MLMHENMHDEMVPVGRDRFVGHPVCIYGIVELRASGFGEHKLYFAALSP